MAKRVRSAAAPDPGLLKQAWVPSHMGVGLGTRDVAFLALIVLSIVWGWQPLVTVMSRSLNSSEYEHYSHIILLPFVGGYVLYLNRAAILERARPGLPAGLLLAVSGAAAIWVAVHWMQIEEPEHRLSLAMLGLITMWAGGFVVSYGLRALAPAA